MSPGGTGIDTIVVVVDPQKGWLNQFTEPTLHALAEELNRGDHWRSVVVTQFMNDEKSPFRTLMPWWKAFQTHSDTDLLQEFIQPRARVFTHDIYGFSPKLWSYCGRQGVKQMVLTGVETDATIVKTAMDAFDRGISVWVPPHLLASTYGPLGQEHGLAILKKVLGRDHILNERETRELFASI